MGKMMEYFEEQIKGVTEEPESEIEFRLMLVNVDKVKGIECLFEDSIAASMIARAMVVLAGTLPEIQKDGPYTIYIGLEEDQIYQIIGGFQTIEAPNEEIAQATEAVLDSLRSIL